MIIFRRIGVSVGMLLLMVGLWSFAPLATSTALAQNDAGGNISSGRGDLDLIGVTKLQTIGSSGNSDFGTIVGWVIKVFLWVASAVAIIYLLIAGFNYITAGGDQEKAGQARQGIINAVIGIVLIMAAFLIFNASTNLGSDLGDNTGSGGGGSGSGSNTGGGGEPIHPTNRP
ncbi:MAG: pilin [bacterium]|nr:pilin [bacterium]